LTTCWTWVPIPSTSVSLPSRGLRRLLPIVAATLMLAVVLRWWSFTTTMWAMTTSIKITWSWTACTRA
jgi:hypothetical protein